MRRKNDLQILIVFILTSIILLSFFLMQNKGNSPRFINDIKIFRSADVDRVLINNVEIGPVSENNIVFSKDLKVKFEIFYTKSISKLSIDGSLNVLNNSFYGITEKDNGKISFVPNFILTPGKHSIEINNNENKDSFSFYVGYNEDFSNSSIENGAWVFPIGTSHNWFSNKNEKILITPKLGNKHASLAFVYPLSNTFIIDFEFSPLGKNVSIVPYVVNSVKNEIVIGSNGNKINLLYHTSETDIKSTIDGIEYEFIPNSRYHVIISRINSILSLHVRELENDEKVNQSSKNDLTGFTKILTFSDLEKNIEGEKTPYHFGVSVWQNSDGITLDDFYILNL